MRLSLIVTQYLGPSQLQCEHVMVDPFLLICAGTTGLGKSQILKTIQSGGRTWVPLAE